MAKLRKEQSYSSIINQSCEQIEMCVCETDAPASPVSSGLSRSVSNLGNTLGAPIVFIRKDNDQARSSFRHPHQRRVLYKNGVSHLIRTNVPLRYARYLRDFGNTMVNSRWRWIILSLIFSFFILWLLFGIFWMLIAEAHGDMDIDLINPRNDTCSVGVNGFAGFLLMSIETQTTIGYGSRYPTEHCPEGIFMICLQMILGIGVQGAIMGMVYVKMTRPAIRENQRLFSRTAVICQRDGSLCFMFRVCDKRRAHIVGTQIKAYMLQTRVTRQEEIIRSYQTPLKLEPFGLLLWPLILVHKIGPESPLYDISAKDLLTKKFEIVVIMVGCSDSTGQMTQSRTSYLATEIRWGHRFKPCVCYDYENHAYIVQKEFFNAIDIVDTPLCSAHRLYQVMNDLDQVNNCTPNNSPTDLSPIPSPSQFSPVDIPSDINFEDLKETFV